MRKINISYRDWYNFFINEDFSDFEVTFCPYECKPMDFHAASDLTATRIADRYENIYIAYSGGLDSEYVLDVFRRNGIKVKAVCVFNPFNKSETAWVDRYCARHNVEVEWLAYDMNRMIDIGNAIMKKVGQPIFPHAFSSMMIDAKYSGANNVIIDGDGQPYNNEGGIFPIDISSYEYIADCYGKTARIHFFNYTQEIFKAYIEHNPDKLEIQDLKSSLYGLEWRPKSSIPDLRLISEIPKVVEKLDEIWHRTEEMNVFDKVISVEDYDKLMKEGGRL